MTEDLSKGAYSVEVPMSREEELLRQVTALMVERAQLRRALTDMLHGWRYIRDVHGDLYGVGWDRAQKAAEDALKQPHR